MSAKLRVKVGETVISWGLLPADVQAQTHERSRIRFAVIEGGRGKPNALEGQREPKVLSA